MLLTFIVMFADVITSFEPVDFGLLTSDLAQHKTPLSQNDRSELGPESVYAEWRGG